MIFDEVMNVWTLRTYFVWIVTAGLFLHVGYSVQDQYVIEANTAVTFRADSVADKLGTLLNEDSAEQVWHPANTNEYIHPRSRKTALNARNIA